ncbi:histidine phosphatase family protein [Micropruina sp.]|uniref:histidine phosphatase family protein n=1 Tax=Micropruina sp. TaxID=2737536 RepID=UPI0026104A0B|nr:histidine phosphatase family protein [Micropruina sp.]
MALTRRAALIGSLAVLAGCSTPLPAPSARRDSASFAAVTLTLLRHGESISSVRGILSTAVPGDGLTAHGADQARLAAQALGVRDFDAVYASPLARATETAEAFTIGRGTSVLGLPGVREISAGAYEGRPARDYGADFVAIVDSWARGALNVRVPGGESGYEFLYRMDAALATVFESGASRPLVVSHGEALRCWLHNRMGAVDDQDLSLDSTGYVVVTLDDAGWKVVEVRPDGYN